MGYVPKRHALLPPFSVALVKHSRVVWCYKRATAECAESFQTWNWKRILVLWGLARQLFKIRDVEGADDWVFVSFLKEFLADVRMIEETVKGKRSVTWGTGSRGEHEEAAEHFVTDLTS